MPNEFAPEGQVYVCGACGKRSKDRYGDKAINHGWDSSCFLHAVLCHEDKLVIESGMVKEVLDNGVVK